VTADDVFRAGDRGLKPGQQTLDAVGGAHRLQSWRHNILTGMFFLS
jgi:hypothetical protein